MWSTCGIRIGLIRLHRRLGHDIELDHIQPVRARHA